MAHDWGKEACRGSWEVEWRVKMGTMKPEPVTDENNLLGSAAKITRKVTITTPLADDSCLNLIAHFLKFWQTFHPGKMFFLRNSTTQQDILLLLLRPPVCHLTRRLINRKQNLTQKKYKKNCPSDSIMQSVLDTAARRHPAPVALLESVTSVLTAQQNNSWHPQQSRCHKKCGGEIIYSNGFRDTVKRTHTHTH